MLTFIIREFLFAYIVSQQKVKHIYRDGITDSLSRDHMSTLELDYVTETN